MRQPLYNEISVVRSCGASRTARCKTYDLVGNERVDYIDIIVKSAGEAVAHADHLHSLRVVKALLKIYAVFSDNPPFTADQLDA